MTAVANKGVVAQQANKAVGTSNAKTLKDWVGEYESVFAKALPKVITAERFTRIALSALSNNAKLMECSPKSFLGALMNAAQLGVEPNTPLGQAYLIPYKNNRTQTMECQFQLGYKGLIDLAYRSGEISVVQAQVVYENDEFIYELGLEPVLSHKPAKSSRGKATHYYAIFKTKNGGYGFEVMSVDDIKQHAKKYSQAYGKDTKGVNPWSTNFDEMAKKTVLKRVLKYAPLRSDFVTTDGTTTNFNVTSQDSEPNLVIEDDGNVIGIETGEVSENWTEEEMNEIMGQNI